MFAFLLPLCRYVAFVGIRNAAAALIFAATPVFAETTVLALGDSLTQGYGLPAEDGFVPRLEAWLTAHGTPAKIVNAGVSGDTTAGGLARLDWSLTPDVDAVIVNLGGNDLLRGLDPAVSRANLEKILQGAAARQLPVLLIGLSAPGNYGSTYKAEYDAIYPDLAASYGAAMNPNFFAAIGGSAEAAIRLGFMQADGIHPNLKGVIAIIENIGPEVQKLIATAAK